RFTRFPPQNAFQAGFHCGHSRAWPQMVGDDYARDCAIRENRAVLTAGLTFTPPGWYCLAEAQICRRFQPLSNSFGPPINVQKYRFKSLMGFSIKWQDSEAAAKLSTVANAAAGRLFSARVMCAVFSRMKLPRSGMRG